MKRSELWVAVLGFTCLCLPAAQAQQKVPERTDRTMQGLQNIPGSGRQPHKPFNPRSGSDDTSKKIVSPGTVAPDPSTGQFGALQNLPRPSVAEQGVPGG